MKVLTRETCKIDIKVSLTTVQNRSNMAADSAYKTRLQFVEDQVLNPNNVLSVDGLLVSIVTSFSKFVVYFLLFINILN